MGRHSWTVDVQSAYLEALTAGPWIYDGRKGRDADPRFGEKTPMATKEGWRRRQSGKSRFAPVRAHDVGAA
jgi:hypothetical protein